MMIIQQLLPQDVERTIRNVTAQVNGFPTIAGSTATGGSQTVRKLARAPPSGHKINEDSKGRSRPAEFNGDSESPATRTNSIETAGTESRIRASNIQRIITWQSSMETAKKRINPEHWHSQVLSPNIDENKQHPNTCQRTRLFQKDTNIETCTITRRVRACQQDTQNPRRAPP